MPHSAMTVLTWALLAAALAGHAALAAAVAAVKAALYAVRKVRHPGASPWLLAAARLGLALALPLALWPVGRPLPAGLLACLLAGELLDRAELYAELAFLTPRRQAERDLAAAAAARAVTAR